VKISMASDANSDQVLLRVVPGVAAGCVFSNSWCREGESIPTVLKGTVKIPPVQTKCNIDAGLGVSSVVCTKSTLGQFLVIWGDFGRRFTRKS
jgi:hypothetical protein